MNLLDRAIGYFSPTAGLKRAHSRKVLRSYQGAEANRLTNHKKPKNQSADQEMLGPFGADSLRAWARALVRDNAYAWNVVDTIVNNIIGEGIAVQSILEDPDGGDVENINDLRDATFAEWCEVCDINGRLTWFEIQQIVQREIVEAGEVLVRYINTPGKTYKGITRPVPLAIELIEADRLAGDKDTYTTAISKDGGNRIIRGVELDDKGKAIAYWIYPDHPNSPYSFTRTPERVPATEIKHLFRQERIGQSRGVTWFAPIMSWLRDLGVYVDNEIQASAVASCFGVVIKSESPVGGLLGPNDEDTVDDSGNSLEYLEPGMVTRLTPGESIESINPGRPNSASEPWINLMLRGICAGTGTSYESVSKDFSKTSYSSSRTSKLEDRPRYKRWQNYIIAHLCQPTWDEFCNAAARAGLDGFPTSTELLASRRKVAPVQHQRPEWEWVDPASEQSAAHDSIASFMSTYADELGSRGRDWRSTFYQAKKEKTLRERLGLLTEAERTQQMMAAQTGANIDGSPTQPSQPEQQAGSGEWMGLSRLQWQRNLKAINDVTTGIESGSMSPAKAQALLAMTGMSQQNIDAFLADAADGTVDNAPPEEVTNAE